MDDAHAGKGEGERPSLRLIRSDGAVPVSYWPDRAEILEAARDKYPDVRSGRQPVVGMAPNGDLWIPAGDRPVLVRRCDVTTYARESGSPPPR